MLSDDDGFVIDSNFLIDIVEADISFLKILAKVNNIIISNVIV